MKAVVASVVFLVALVNGEYTPVVKIAQGKLRGQRSILTGQNKYLGIPYAVSERFQAPQRPPNWQKIFYATDALILCPQKIIGLPIGSENCTVLNVYTPLYADSSSSLPVMIFFHGGSFFYGSGSVTNFDPAYLVEHDVIIVTANYRLGVLGFLCLGIEEAEGNMGLKDQAAAIRWVHENIKAFGGDPNKVTIFGESAGAAAVNMHMVSKMSRGLFHGAIMQSGSALSPWAINMNPVESAKKDALKLGVASGDVRDILDAFKAASLMELLDATQDSVLHNVYKYCPCVENNVPEERAFLTDTPYNLMIKGDVADIPVMMGMNSAEGIFFAGLHNRQSFSDMDLNFFNYIPRVFAWDSLEMKEAVANAIRRFYFGSSAITKSVISNVIDFYSDTLITYSLPKTSEILTSISSAPVYSYHFNYNGGRNFAKYFMGVTTNGVSHADDLFYIFKPSSIPLPIAQKDKLIVKRMTKMWTNFAKIGNPTPERTKILPAKWLPSVPNRTIYMNIDTKMFMIRQPYQRRIAFWEELYSAFGRQGFVPTEVRKNT